MGTSSREAALNRARVQRHRSRLATAVDASDDALAIHTWREAPRYTANGYNPVPISIAEINEGREYPPGQPFMAKVAEYIVPESRVADTGICLNAGGHVLVSGMHPVPTISVLRLDILEDIELAARIVDTIVKPCLSWAADVETRHMPVRETLGAANLLLPLRLDGDPRFGSFEAARFIFASDAQSPNPYLPRRYNTASIGSWSRTFVASGAPYKWRQGLDLTGVPRVSLPIVEKPRELLRDIERELEAHGAKQNFKFINIA